MKTIALSFEIFPTTTPKALENLNETCVRLNQFKPRFISVTFGASGAAQLKSLHVVEQLAQQAIPTTPHISCVNMTKDSLQQLLNAYRQYGIKNLLVVRGDIPGNGEGGFSDFKYASDLVAYIRQTTGDYFHITVAAYPELPTTREDDFMYLKHKIDAGANEAITQFFFNSETYLRFRDACYARGITAPIIPGIMPIQDYPRLLRIACACGAQIPLWLRKRLESLNGDVFSIRLLGLDLIRKLCEQLLLSGAPGLHFYTLNQANTASHIYSNLFADDKREDFFNWRYAAC
ncbi:MAG: 5,10-methylenetetrahydrofolate reductase [Gammaproteobacteria bacterium]|nr:5,10-methylenetetrahydrofolate reductase [Gammaproteobacteria bacterium]